MTVLFSGVAHSYDVSMDEVRQSLVRRPIGVDFAVMVSFGIFYAVMAYQVARRMCRTFPLGGWDSVAALVVTLVAAILISCVGLMVGDLYSTTIESIRLGTGHLSYRADRIPWNHHSLALFLSGVLLFCLIAGLRYRVGGTANTETEWGRATMR